MDLPVKMSHGGGGADSVCVRPPANSVLESSTVHLRWVLMQMLG